MNKIKQLLARFYQPSSPFWRKIGDTALALIPVLEVAQFSNPTWQDYRTVVYVCLIAFKFLTNFSKTPAQ